LLEEALSITRKNLGEEHNEIARSLINLALVEFDLGNFSKAKESYEETLCIYIKNIGE